MSWCMDIVILLDVFSVPGDVISKISCLMYRQDSNSLTNTVHDIVYYVGLVYNMFVCNLQ